MLYSVIALGFLGSIALFLFSEPTYIAGWWTGLVVATLNYRSLSDAMRGLGFEENEAAMKWRMIKTSIVFIGRYAIVGFAFYFTFMLGRWQLAACLVAFMMFHIILFIHFLIKSQKESAL